MAIALLLALAGMVCGEQIFLAGDSWTGGGRQFIAEFEKRGDRRSIRNIGVGGTTCRGWANPGPFGWLQRLVNHVRDYPEVEYVWFICGGNDAINNLLGCTPMAECIERLIAESKENVKMISEAVYAANPRVKIAGFGYDIFPFGGQGYAHCSIFAAGMFPGCIGAPDVPMCVNTEFMKIQEVYDWAAASFPNFESTNLVGTLQKAGGVPNSDIGRPNLSYWSPTPSFAQDCIHPSGSGYTSLFEAYYDRFWGTHESRKTGNATYVNEPHPTEKEYMAKIDAQMHKYYVKGMELLNITQMV